MLPGARLITVAGAAHFPWIEAPELVFSSVDTFLRGKWPMQAERIREGEVEIRIANYSKVPIENLRVYFGSQIEEYGTVAAKGVTEYRKVRNAYRYARIEAIVERERAQLQPIDFVGEAELKPGSQCFRTLRLAFHKEVTTKNGHTNTSSYVISNIRRLKTCLVS
jgi:hypothetical protein